MTAPAVVTRRRCVGPRVPKATESILTLDVLGPPVLEVVVDGSPATQGSHVYKGHRNKTLKNGTVKSIPLVLDHSGAGLTAWRERVATTVMQVLPVDWVTLDCPLVMDLIISVPRFKSTPKTLRTLPATAGKGSGDVSKFARATEDGLGTTFPKLDPRGRKIFEDDSRITNYRVGPTKVFVGDVLDPDALRHPGAVIRLWEYPETLLGKITTMVL